MFNVNILGFCGLGTKLKHRLVGVDRPINKLHEKCLEHDRFCSREKDNKLRNEVDNILADEAFKRINSSDASLSERIAA